MKSTTFKSQRVSVCVTADTSQQAAQVKRQQINFSAHYKPVQQKSELMSH